MAMSVCLFGNIFGMIDISNEWLNQNGDKFQNGGQFQLNYIMCVVYMLKELIILVKCTSIVSLLVILRVKFFIKKNGRQYYGDFNILE